MSQFIVYRDSQGLEHPGQRLVQHLGTGAFHSPTQIGRGRSPSLLKKLTDRASDPPRLSFFSVALDHLSQRLFRKVLGDPGRCRYALIRIHAHVEGAVRSEAEPPLRLVDLMRRNSQVEKSSMQAFHSLADEQFLQPGEGPLHHDRSITKRRQTASGFSHRFWIAIHGDQAPFPPEHRQNNSAVPSPPGGGVQICPFRVDDDSLGHFVGHNGNVENHDYRS